MNLLEIHPTRIDTHIYSLVASTGDNFKIYYTLTSYLWRFND